MLFEHQFSSSNKFGMNTRSGIMVQNNEINLSKDTFLKILNLENKLEKKCTKQHMDSLIVLYTKLVEHYNMKKDPIHIYFLERIKNYLSKTNSLKLYYNDEIENDSDKRLIWEDEIENSVFYSDEERSPNKALCEMHSYKSTLQQQHSSQRRDSFENLIEQKKLQLRKSISFINYQQAKKSMLQEEIYDLERKRNERNLKLSVFKEIFLNQDNKNNELKQIIQNYEELSEQKDNIVKSDIDQQVNSIQQRIQIKRDNQFKKSLTIELNTPRSHRDDTSGSRPSLLSNTKRTKQKMNTENDLESQQNETKYDNQVSTFQNNTPSQQSNSSRKNQKMNYFSSQQQVSFNNQDSEQLSTNQSEKKQNGILKQNLVIKDFQEKLRQHKINQNEMQEIDSDQFNKNNTHLGSLQDNSYYTSEESLEEDENNLNLRQQICSQGEFYLNQQNTIKEVASQEQSFLQSQKESVSPSKYMKDFGYDNE